MISKNKKLKHQSRRDKSLLAGQSSSLVESDRYFKNFRFSFEYLDRSQGQTFADWEKEKLLVKMLETLSCYCKETIIAKQGNSFKEYGEFPSKSGFKHPKHIDKDVNWCALHITGKVVLGGFIQGNTFFVVFLDKNHQFWISEKKHT